MKGGKFRGIRGATYKLALTHHASSRLDEPIWYGSSCETSSDLYMELYFFEAGTRDRFVNAVRNLELLPDIVRKTAEDYKPTYTETLFDPEHISMKKMKSIRAVIPENITPPGSINFDFDSSVQDLGSFVSSQRPSKRSRSRSASGSSRSSARLGDTLEKRMLDMWQSIEKHDSYKPFQALHIINKGTSSAPLKHNPDNFLGGSYEFHNGFDGLNTNPKSTPRFLVEFVGIENGEVQAEDGVRKKVRVRLVFRNDDEKGRWIEIFRKDFKDDSVFNDDGTIEAFVHVRNPSLFQSNLAWKVVQTKNAW